MCRGSHGAYASMGHVSSRRTTDTTCLSKSTCLSDGPRCVPYGPLTELVFSGTCRGCRHCSWTAEAQGALLQLAPACKQGEACMLMELFADAGAALTEGLRLAPDSAGLQAAMAHLRREWPEAAEPAPGPPAAAAGADWGSAAKRCGWHGVKVTSCILCCEASMVCDICRRCLRRHSQVAQKYTICS